MRLSDQRGIAREPGRLRLASRLLFEHGRARGLVAFRIADTHAHALVSTSREHAGRFAQCAESSLRQRLALPVGFEPARIRPLANEAHLRNAVKYLLRQESHHGTDFDPAHDGSSLPDFLGMRHIGGDAALARLRDLLPRLTQAELLGWASLPRLLDAEPDPLLVGDAAAAAFGLPDVRGPSDTHHLARLAAAHAVQLPSDGLARILGVCRRGVQRYRRTPIAPEIVRAVVLQLHLRTALRSRTNPWDAPPAALGSANL